MTPRINRRPQRVSPRLGAGWVLSVRGRVVVRVVPQPDGWRVSNHQAGTARLVPSLAAAEALADRIARLAATP